LNNSPNSDSRTQFAFAFRRSVITYNVWGSGSKIVFAFHGFGQTKDDFKILADSLAKDYTFYCFDLFFHGSSHWYDTETPLNKDFWQKLISAFTSEKGIEKLSVCGFSIGSKFALATLEALPDQIEELWLLAPDGIKDSLWYSIATSPGPGRAIFRQMINKPTLFYNSAKTLSSLGLVDKGTVKFAQSQMRSLERRKQVYQTWTVFAGLKFDVRQIIMLLNKSNIKTRIFLGKRDSIIKAKSIEHFASQLSNNELHTFNTSHHKLIEATANYFKDKYNR
jgi:pimeloyl-ACP methyl ester carboxylesterase